VSFLQFLDFVRYNTIYTVFKSPPTINSTPEWEEPEEDGRRDSQIIACLIRMRVAHKAFASNQCITSFYDAELPLVKTFDKIVTEKYHAPLKIIAFPFRLLCKLATRALFSKQHMIQAIAVRWQKTRFLAVQRCIDFQIGPPCTKNRQQHRNNRSIPSVYYSDEFDGNYEHCRQPKEYVRNILDIFTINLKCSDFLAGVNGMNFETRNENLRLGNDLLGSFNDIVPEN
ncbi:hypothetical protein C0J52_12229, partial [Blattella germanica]